MNIVTNIPAPEAAKIALRARLYVSGWGLSKQLVRVSKGQIPNAKISLCEKGGKYVGVAINGVDKYWNTAVFVRKSERKKGIGSKLLNSVKTSNSKAGYGIPGSEQFWDKNNIAWCY